jgi:hypothetical protein
MNYKTNWEVKTVQGKYCYKYKGYWFEFGVHFPNRWTQVIGEDHAKGLLSSKPKSI